MYFNSAIFGKLYLIYVFFEFMYLKNVKYRFPHMYLNNVIFGDMYLNYVFWDALGWWLEKIQIRVREDRFSSQVTQN